MTLERRPTDSGLAIDVLDQLEGTDASHLVEDLGPYRRSGLGLGSVGIDEYGDQRSAADARATVFTNLGEGPGADRPSTRQVSGRWRRHDRR